MGETGRGPNPRENISRIEMRVVGREEENRKGTESVRKTFQGPKRKIAQVIAKTKS